MHPDDKPEVEKYFRDKTPENLELLLLAYMPQIQKIANSIPDHQRAVFDREDMVQVGTLGFVACLQSFDITLQISFFGYAYKRVRGAMVDAIRKTYMHRTNSPAIFSLDANPFDIIQDKEEDITLPSSLVNSSILFSATDSLSRGVEKLPYRQALAILFLFNGIPAKNLATLFEISKSQLLQDRNKALHALKNHLISEMKEK